MSLAIEQLIESCIKRDRKSQKQFYLLTCDRLMNISRRYTSDVNDAKDVLQNAYVNIFKNLHTFDLERGELDSWLCKIVINEALQLLRKKKNLMIKEERTQQVFASVSAPEVVSRLHAEDLMLLINRLPAGYRIVFNMSVVEGYSHKEIAEQLGINESTSRSQLTRAKKMLRDLLENQKITELC